MDDVDPDGLRPDEEAETPDPPGSESGVLANTMAAYLHVFSRPPLGDHPKMNGFTCGRVLAEEYPDRMMEVMEGFRQGVKSGTEAAQRAGGQRDE